jgi:hypothetical protein
MYRVRVAKYITFGTRIGSAMNDTRSQIIMGLFAWVPYVLVSWAYAKLSDGSFWAALGVLLGVRLFFGVIETLGSVLAWRVYGRKKAIEANLAVLRASAFPRRTYRHDDFLNYLSRIEDDESCTGDVKAAAKQWHQTLALYESMGILVGMRMHAAADAALDIYSPRNDASVFGATAV